MLVLVGLIHVLTAYLYTVAKSTGCKGYLLHVFCKICHAHRVKDTHFFFIDWSIRDQIKRFGFGEPVRERAQVTRSKMDDFNPGEIFFRTTGKEVHVIACMYCIYMYVLDVPLKQIK